MSTFAFIKPANTLWKDAKIHKTVNKIVEKVTALPEPVRKDKHNMELLLMICLMIENEISNKDKKEKLKIDKKSLAVQILTTIYGQMQPQEIQTICNHIEYLHDHDMIVKIPLYKIIPASCWAWLKGKLA
jgi:hypothetical protein